jgi:hypothetical protein
MAIGMFNDDEAAFPYPHLSVRSQLVIEAAIHAAWKLTLSSTRFGFNLQTADEDTITEELYSQLFDRLFNKGVVDGFDDEIFASIRREPKITNYNHAHPDKMPDLFVDFIDRPAGVLYSQYGLFIECKPVDRQHPAGSTYCDEGIIRFLQGDYAWAMRNAMMVGYAREGYTLTKFREALTSVRKNSLGSTKIPFACPRSPKSDLAECVVISEHERSFNYVGTNTPAGAISIRHLWLRRPN